MECDFNQDGVLDICEVEMCLIMIENEWRDEYCPGYGHVYCESTFICGECIGFWDCNDVFEITEELWAEWNTNGDDFINNVDDIESEHLTDIMMYCDFNNDGSVTKCELFDCVVVAENEWRDENCDWYGDLNCVNPYEPCN